MYSYALYTGLSLAEAHKCTPGFIIDIFLYRRQFELPRVL